MNWEIKITLSSLYYKNILYVSELQTILLV